MLALRGDLALVYENAPRRSSRRAPWASPAARDSLSWTVWRPSMSTAIAIAPEPPRRSAYYLDDTLPRQPQPFNAQNVFGYDPWSRSLGWPDGE
ncbi:MAG: hypothetical protein R3E12_17615 [Candidatus Eisenbacteria bacterium]